MSLRKQIVPEVRWSQMLQKPKSMCCIQETVTTVIAIITVRLLEVTYYAICSPHVTCFKISSCASPIYHKHPVEADSISKKVTDSCITMANEGRSHYSQIQVDPSVQTKHCVSLVHVLTTASLP